VFVKETATFDSDVFIHGRLEAERRFTVYDSEMTPRILFQKASVADWEDAVRGSGGALLNPNERPTSQPDYQMEIASNLIVGRDSDDVVVFNSRIASKQLTQNLRSVVTRHSLVN
jgi:hypothetical protein